MITEAGIVSMGFEKYPNENILEATFGALCIYSIEGPYLTTDDSIGFLTKPFDFGLNCKAIFSDCIDEACIALTGGMFSDSKDDLEDYIKQKKAQAPFLVIYFKESVPRIIEGKYRKTELNGDIYIYDAFIDDKTNDVTKWEKNELPNILSSTSAIFSEIFSSFKIKPVDVTRFGLTAENVTVHNIKVTIGPVTLSRVEHQSIDDIEKLMIKSTSLYGKVKDKSQRHIAAALAEKDGFKKFLFYFFFLEQFINAQYTKIDNADVSVLFKSPDRLSSQGGGFLNKLKDDANAPKAKFKWCALTIWKDVEDDDLVLFDKLISIRNDIAHGRLTDESKLPVEDVQRLALKLIRNGK
ncbi:hypothetical protein [Colwellia sp. Bg11-12]|uniref:hypothetical protein n=1 Tax=Colwellia sp. Bg11-12 TaxID=2759817 RepID=UPI0015F61788|nr:hypothetical protein [Colwellia sp. Bg11-12]MBA6264295.1 hypothetical protein [Colwellia sp. Bg11-12]